MSKRAGYAVLAVMVLGSTGCSVAAKQALYTVMGASGKFYEVKVVDPEVLATFRSLRVEGMVNDLGEHLPVEVIEALNENTPTMLAKSRLFFPQGKQLVVKGKVIHFTGQSALLGSVSALIGGREECACRMQLVDGESGEVIGEAVCWGVVKSALRRGPEELAIGVMKGIEGWIHERMPKEERDRRRQELKEDKEAESEEAEEEEESQHEEDETEEEGAHHENDDAEEGEAEDEHDQGDEDEGKDDG